MSARKLRLLCAGWVLLVFGCASGPSWTDWSRPQWSMFGSTSTADVPPGVVAPKEHIAELRRTAAAAKNYSEAEREEISTQLCQGLRAEQDALIRCEVLRTLAALKTAQGDAMLRAGMQDPDVEVRVVCCEAWGARGGAEALSLLADVVSQDESVDVRLAAARGLGDLGDRGAVPALGTLLEDPNPAVQRRAVASLERVTGERLGNDVNAWIAYVQQGAPQRELSLAERLFRWY